MIAHLSQETFKEMIFDFSANSEWEFKGSKPTLVDFYANWCGPCKMIAPVLEELAREYDGKIDIYKVNTELEPALSSLFGIRSIPSLLFIPLDGKPQMVSGALPKNSIVNAFKDLLGVDKT